MAVLRITPAPGGRRRSRLMARLVSRHATLLAALLMGLAIAGTARAEAPPLRPEARRINVDFHEADIRSVLLAFSEFSGTSIIASRNVQGKITARIAEEPWDKALYSLLENNGLSVREKEGILNVDTIENLRATEKLEDLISRLYRLSYHKAAEIGPTVAALLSERGRLQADEGSNSLLVIDIPGRLDQIAAVLEELDRETRQVEIRVQLTFINQRKLRELGIDWRLSNSSNPLTDTRLEVNTRGAGELIDPYADVAVGTVRKGINLAAMISALENSNQARTVARPVITTLNNLPAKVLVGQRTPLRVVDYGASSLGNPAGMPRITAQIVETGVKLEVTPQITEDNKIMIQILAENSDAESGADGVFFRTQEANTRLLLENGASGAIAGLTVRSDTKIQTGVPGVRRIPLVGRLFSYDKDVIDEEELVIIITARIINPGEAGTELIPDPRPGG